VIPTPQKLIEHASGWGAEAGVAVGCEDEAGPLQAAPQPGSNWQPACHPATQLQEWIRGGTTKRMTLLEPATGPVAVQAAASGTHPVLPGWRKKERDRRLATLPPAMAVSDPEANRAQWAAGPEGLPSRFRLPADLARRRALRVWDHRAGQKTAARVWWLCAPGMLPLETPWGGSGLHRAAARQRLLQGRALAGQYAEPGEQMGNWRQAVATGWNEPPPPFVWGGPRRARQRQRPGGSGACVQRWPPSRKGSFHGK
jgi:hypothetical protein